MVKEHHLSVSVDQLCNVLWVETGHRPTHNTSATYHGESEEGENRRISTQPSLCCAKQKAGS